MALIPIPLIVAVISVLGTTGVNTIYYRRKLLNSQHTADNATRLLENRMNSYPKIYNHLSTLSKAIEHNENVNQAMIVEFLNTFMELDSTYGILFDSETVMQAVFLRDKLTEACKWTDTKLNKNQEEISKVIYSESTP